MAKTKQKLSDYRCAQCGRRLPQDEWVYSRFTGNRYCLEGKCKKPRHKGDA
jgi:hypothetical protein